MYQWAEIYAKSSDPEDRKQAANLRKYAPYLSLNSGPDLRKDRDYNGFEFRI